MPLFWRFQILGWLAYALLTLPLKAVFFQSISYAVLVTLSRESFGFLATVGFRYLYLKGGLRTSKPWLLAGLVLSVAFAFSALDTALNWWIVNLTDRPGNNDPVFGIFCYRALLFTVWSLLYFTIKDIMAARARVADLRKAELAARDAEILMLRAQVSPHFLFNAFNTILADLDGRNPELVPVVRGLSDYFRYSLSSHDEVFVSMEREFEAIRNYLTVEKARFQESLVVECEMDPALGDVAVPGIFLQPVVENALKYGNQTSATPLRLSVKVFPTEEGYAIVEVTNSGSWVEPAEQSRDTKSGTGGQGLSVLRKRLELLCPETHRLEILADQAAETVTVRICLDPTEPLPTAP